MWQHRNAVRTRSCLLMGASNVQSPTNTREVSVSFMERAPPTTTLLPPTLQGPIAASLSSKGFHGMWNLLLAKCRREKHLEIASSENYVTNAALVRNNACWHSLNMLQIIYRSQQNSFRVPGPESELVCFMLVKTFSLNKIQSLGTAWAFQTAFSP